MRNPCEYEPIKNLISDFYNRAPFDPEENHHDDTRQLEGLAGLRFHPATNGPCRPP